MAHKTKINGTAYEITGGKTKINGTAYEITGGKTKINGTAYDISFGPEITNYLTFSSDTSFGIHINILAGWDGIVYYSYDSMRWREWDGSQLWSQYGNGAYYLYFAGLNNSVITDSWMYGFVISGSGVSCTGNLESLLDYEKVNNGIHPSMSERCYKGLFRNCTSLTTAPSLPATTLANQCYSSMFEGCTSLTTAPSLPATTLANQCYSSMFEGCTSLTTAPSLPATTLAAYCYSYMFEGCTSLTTAPSLPATTLAAYCYSYMFSECSTLKVYTSSRAGARSAWKIPSVLGKISTVPSTALHMMMYNTNGDAPSTPTLSGGYVIFYTQNTPV